MIINLTKKIRKCIYVTVMVTCVIGGITYTKNDYKDVQAINMKEIESINEYEIDVVFEDESKRLICNQTVTYVNNTEKDLDKIYFHIYPNAFSKKEFTPFEKTEVTSAYPNGFNEGYIDIKKLVSNDKDMEYKIKGNKDDILEINLDNTLSPKESIELEFKYNIKIPNSVGRFGYGEDTINITNWFPIACVYDERGWNTKGYEVIGDPFYSDTSKFNVSVLIPSKYKLATTGEIKSEKTDNKKTLYDIEAINVRDFAFVMSDKFKIKEGNVGDTKVYSYYLDDKFGNLSLEIAKDSIKIFNKLFGEYPYNTYSVIASDFFIGGMEYPTLVMIDKSLYTESEKFLLEYVIAHETAHQWWYSVIGNDEISEPWIDEALTEYSTVLYFEEKYGKEVGDKLIKSMEVRSDKHSPHDVFKSTTQYDSSLDYSLKVYTKGAVVFDKIREKVGDEIFFGALQEYYNTYMFKNVNGAKFIALWKEKGVDLNKIIEECN